MDEIVCSLIDATSYRKFLEDLYKWILENNPRFSYSRFALLLGFQSRNAAREIVQGRRRLTARSLQQLLHTLSTKRSKTHMANLILPRFNKDHLRYLELLVYCEEPDLDTNKETNNEPKIESRVSAELLTLREFLKQNTVREDSKTHLVKANGLYEALHWPRVYAALGDEKGASISEIRSRCGLTEKKIEKTLKHLMQFGLVQGKEDRFVAVSQFVHASEIASDKFFKLHFQNSARHLIAASNRDFNHPSQLFYAANFSVETQNLPELCRELKELLERFAQHSDRPMGDRVVRLTAALTL